MTYDTERTLWGLTRGQRLRYASAMLFMGLGHLFLLQVPRITGSAIDVCVAGDSSSAPGWLGFAGNSSVHPLWIAAAAVVVVTGIGGVFHYLRGRGAAVASEAIVRRLRERLYLHLQELPRSYHDGAETGDLVQRCSSDVETVRVFLSGQVVEIGRAVLLLLIVIPLMLTVDVRMTAASLVLFPLIITFALLFFRKVQALFKKMDEAEGKLTAVLQENLTGIRVVRAFARQDFEQRKFAERSEDFRDRTRRLLNGLADYWAFSDLLCMSQIGIALFAGAHWLLRGEISVGTVFTFLMYVSFVIWPVRHLGRVLADTGKAIVALGRIREILAVAPESDLDGDRASRRAPSGEVEVRDLHFAFTPGRPVLRGVSLHIRPGETLALLGPPGSGKSVFIHLLLRLYDYEQGSIRLDGAELSSLSRRNVRSRIGVVLQEPFLYSRTIGANLRVGRPDAGPAEISVAAADACIRETIEGFEDGYETLVGERGVMLSGGQRQRTALARALLKDPDVLVLDDALSAVDTETETRILSALRRRHGRRTTILIAHRLSSVAAADRILVLDGGGIVQAGTHRELTRTEGPYRRLWRIQGALEDEIASDLGGDEGGGR